MRKGVWVYPYRQSVALDEILATKLMLEEANSGCNLTPEDLAFLSFGPTTTVPPMCGFSAAASAIENTSFTWNA